MPTSPISPTFVVPSKELPNAHPYAIKSSSSAILTRSNSTSNPVTHHHYVPVERIQYPNRKRRYVPSRKLDKTKVDESSVLNPGDESVVIPTPPISLRKKRGDTLPPSFPVPGKTEPPDVLKDLPINPKQWSPSQLAKYLSSVLRLRGGAAVPSLVMRDITAFIVNQHLTGRVFLKMSRNDYNALDINPLWKEALVNASLTLRRSVLEDQVFGSIRASMVPADDLSLLRETEEDDNVITSPATPGSYVPWDRRRTLGRLQSGRVKGIAHNYERSYSEGEAGFVPNNTQSGSSEQSGSDDDASFVDSPVSERSDLSKENQIAELSLLPEKEADSYAEDPTVEELIQAQESHSSTLWGARAWERESSQPVIVTAKKITREEGSAEEILNESVGRKKRLTPETLASVFFEPVPETVTREVESAMNNLEIKRESEHCSVSSSLESADDMDPSPSERSIPPPVSDSSADSSAEPLFNPFYISDPSATSFESHQAVTSKKTDVSVLTEDNEDINLLRKALQSVQDRLTVVEKRLYDLEKQGVRRDCTTDDRESEIKAESDKISLRHPILPTTSTKSQIYDRDIVDEDIHQPNPPKNYALSDLNVYSYMFYASIGLAAMVLDRTVFGRRRE